MQVGQKFRFSTARSRGTRRRGVVRVATMLAIPMLLSFLVGVIEMTRLLSGMAGSPGAVEGRTRFAQTVADSNSRELNLVKARP